MQRTKVDARCSLGEQRLTHLLRIKEEGPVIGSFDVTPVVKLWSERKVRRSNQNKRKKYKQRKQKSKKYHDKDNYNELFSLVDSSSDNTDSEEEVADEDSPCSSQSSEPADHLPMAVDIYINDSEPESGTDDFYGF